MSERYRVARPQVSGKRPIHEVAEKPVLRPRAVFVAHGMGQQVRFETLDDVARGLCKAIEAHDMKVEQTTARTVRVGCEQLQRLELKVKSVNGDELPSVHVYEAYWAPLTEGVIGLWQVVRFLLTGGWNGIRSDAQLRRFMFGQWRRFPISRWSIAALIIVILTVIAMVVVGGTIAGVSIARFTFDEKGWVKDALVGDLTALFELLLGVVAGGMALAAAIITVGSLLKKRSSELAAAINWLTVIPATAIILALWLTAYVAIPVYFIFDEKEPFPGRDCPWCPSFCAEETGAFIAWLALGLRGLVDAILRCMTPERGAWWALIGFSLAVLVYSVVALLTRPKDQASPRGQGGKWAGFVLALLILGGVLALCGSNAALAFVTWLLLFAAVLFVRTFLIQYLGDVAIYVCSHLVDRFFDLRERIRTVVWRAARAVYAMRDADGKFLYQGVVVAGHSLGSAVVYDTLNRLINDDDLVANDAQTLCCETAPPENLHVAGRTRLLLTFGSPLDKFAFIFAEHASHSGTERDALAAAKQPLITHERPFRWVNVFSPFDILGGSLEFYDTPKGDEDPNIERVRNEPDEEAITPIVAHTEFWKNKLIYERMLEGLSLRP